MKKIIAVICLFVGFFGIAESAPSCKGLTGTWQVTYKITETSSTTFVITKVASDGTITGAAIGLYGPPMKGYCRNGMVHISDISSDSGLSSYFFANDASGFGKLMFTFGSASYAPKAFNFYWFPALVQRASIYVNAKPTDETRDIEGIKLKIIDEIEQLGEQQ